MQIIFFKHFCNLHFLDYICIIKNKNATTMLTAELDTPKLRKQVIDDDDVVINLDFPTPQTPEEARKEIEEIEEEIRQGKFVTHEEGMAMIDKMIKEYETRLVG